MAHTQLKGRIFKHDGVNYLIIEDNDFTSDRLNVRSVDRRRCIREMPLQEVLQALPGWNTTTVRPPPR